MPLRQRCIDVTRQVSVPGDIGRQAVFQQTGVVGAADPVGKGRGELGTGPVMLESVGNGAETGGHCRAVDHGENRLTETRGEFDGRRLAIVQPHHALDQNQVGVRRRR